MSKIKKYKKLYLIMLLVGLLICIIRIGYKFYSYLIDDLKVYNFIFNNKSDYIGVLEIEKINLRKGFYGLDNENNNVNENIEVIKKSDMPDISNGTLIIASHSGNGQVAYFKKLYRLILGDIINIYYKNKKYQYKLIDIYEVDKSGVIELDKKRNFTSLILVTCSKEKEDKQVVYVSKLINVYNIIK